MNNTVLINKNWKITKGHAFYSKFGDRMATIIEDTVGTNVVTGGFCNPGLNRVRYGVEGTHTCQANSLRPWDNTICRSRTSRKGAGAHS